MLTFLGSAATISCMRRRESMRGSVCAKKTRRGQSAEARRAFNLPKMMIFSCVSIVLRINMKSSWCQDAENDAICFESVKIQWQFRKSKCVFDCFWTKNWEMQFSIVFDGFMICAWSQHVLLFEMIARSMLRKCWLCIVRFLFWKFSWCRREVGTPKMNRFYMFLQLFWTHWKFIGNVQNPIIFWWFERGIGEYWFWQCFWRFCVVHMECACCAVRIVDEFNCEKMSVFEWALHCFRHHLDLIMWSMFKNYSISLFLTCDLNSSTIHKKKKRKSHRGLFLESLWEHCCGTFRDPQGGHWVTLFIANRTLICWKQLVWKKLIDKS